MALLVTHNREADRCGILLWRGHVSLCAARVARLRHAEYPCVWALSATAESIRKRKSAAPRKPTHGRRVFYFKLEISKDSELHKMIGRPSAKLGKLQKAAISAII